MGDLIAPVKDGTVEQYTSEVAQKKSTVGTSELGKDAFLQLLVAQMKYQDPLNPASDTEFISQLAQFSALEQMQNLNSSMSNAQAFGYVGQTVVVNTQTTNGEIKQIQGVVDYVSVSNGKAYVSIDDELYLASDVVSVLDQSYLAKMKAPKVPKQQETFDFNDSEYVKLSVSLGEDAQAATGFGIIIDNKAIDASYLEYDEDKSILTIKRGAFADLESGKTYSVVFVFNDEAVTTITDKVTISVIGNKPVTTETSTAEDKTTEDTTTGDTTTGDTTTGETSAENTEDTTSE